jgi:ATP-binding cassette subfamily F protein 3
MSLITAASLSKSFGAEDIFREVSFSVARGARLALIGPNGIGKTTLLRILVGLEEPSSGKVTRLRSLRMGYLPQEADFQLEGTVWDACESVFADLIRQQGELAKLELEMSDESRREQALERYGRLQQDFEHRGGYLYQNRIKQVLTGPILATISACRSITSPAGSAPAYCSAAALEPDVLLLDEPTTISTSRPWNGWKAS